MIGIQLRNMMLLSLILSISIIPTICAIVEDAEEVAGFSRIRPLSTELEDDDQRPYHESGCAAIACSGLTGAAICAAHGCFLGCGSSTCR
ncbi:secreted protein [Melampsora americana]|nr:secreted protein [Melampsora americana]